MRITLIWSRRAVAMLVCMSMPFFFSSNSGRDLGEGGGSREGGRREGGGREEGTG